MQPTPPPRRRWPRSQRFVLSERGRAADASYLATIVASRATAGRESYDAARTEWAAACGIQPDDGLYLAEVASGPKTLAEIVAALETCGKTKDDALAALGRLFDAELITEAVSR